MQTPGVTLTRWLGGSTPRLARALGADRLWASLDGRMASYHPVAPAFVNGAFLRRYPDGLPAGTPVLIHR